MKNILEPLDANAAAWVNNTLAAMDIRERVGQLLIPICHVPSQYEEIHAWSRDIPFGGLFVGPTRSDELRDHVDRMQANHPVPLIIAADLEYGAGHVVDGLTRFPDPLALAATDDESLAYLMGQVTAREGRAAGIHWTFAPITDVNRNPDNPITNTRSFGDDPKRVARMASAMIRGLQDHGMAACPKHFPGDGYDDVDQHITTSINPLTMDDWERESGHAFRSAYEAGAWTTMIGHIALPSHDPKTDPRGVPRPASINPRLARDLLRQRLGFGGLAVSDDMNMGGVAGYMNRRDRLPACVEAGCDMILCHQRKEDFQILLNALDAGTLSVRRVEEAARRVLELKARLKLHEKQTPEIPSDAERALWRKASRDIANQAVTLVRDFGHRLPLRDLKPGSRVLTVTLAVDDIDLPVVDEELRARGYHVDHLLNPVDYTFVDTVRPYDAVFVNFATKAGWAIGTVRTTGAYNRLFMFGFFMEHPRTVFTSFGSPYHLRTHRTLPNYINAHSSGADSQRAAVAAWLGEQPINGKSPVSRLEYDATLYHHDRE